MVAAMRGIAPKQPEDVSLDYLSHHPGIWNLVIWTSYID